MVRFALIVAVNGLRDRDVSRDLMKNPNFTWALLHETLRAREMANNSDRFLRTEAGRSVLRGSPKSNKRYYGSEEHDTSRYGTIGREYNKDSDSRKYRDNYSREGDKGNVGYDRRGSSRWSGGSRDNSYERYGSRDSSRERYRDRESPSEMRDKLSRYRDNSMDRFEGEKYKERRETSRCDERYWDNSTGRSVRFSGSRDKYDEDS
ncbi:serine/threonine-protein kinase fray2-like [Watersipora subatra]|uniref:serine/threonine-protein kinase fray2-like n=1 Tax=Watersipora subatra TaxID=2589382 RepID=UPI00355BE021